MKKLTIGIIAHVDSGKTTLSEALLYLSGSIRNFGRVDKGASFLDNDNLERSRGITIFSKQARFTCGNTKFVLIDTPGHTDFSAETERTLQILDYAILLISASDGIRGQTKTLWHLLSEYRVPVFLFVNKMDQEGADKNALLKEINTLADGAAVDFSPFSLTESAEGDAASLQTEMATDADSLRALYEQMSLGSEDAMEEYLETGSLKKETIRFLIRDRKLFPCIFGAALKTQGVPELLKALDLYTLSPAFPEAFAARVYKVAREKDGTRLTFVKITGGKLKTRDVLMDGGGESRITQIRFYSGEKYVTGDTAFAGDICALTGLKESYAGQGFGASEDAAPPILCPVLSYRVLPPAGTDAASLFAALKVLEEETPELSVTLEEDRKELYVNVMGQVQLEILSALLKERFGMDAAFDAGEVVYRETIAKTGTGVGHFEPLRHYAEVHLRMEPLERGSGLLFASEVSTDRLSKNWQRLILTHLQERIHRGVLTGAPITDMKITLTAGKAHLKHTEGGDFRQAVYRAVRQGLMMTENLLLEPYYRFLLEIPTSATGRAMTDLDQMHAEFTVPETDTAKGISVLSGRGPVSALKDYPKTLSSYTRGEGRITFTPDGYDLCQDAEEVIFRKGYDPLRDLKNPADSVFCVHGAGHIVPYSEVYAHMHLAFDGSDKKADAAEARTAPLKQQTALGTEEIDAIIAGFSKANSRSKNSGTSWKKKYGTAGKKSRDFSRSGPPSDPSNKNRTKKPLAFPLEDAEYLLVDGYNVIFAWEDLSALADENIDAARDALADILSKYRSMVQTEVIVVFDAYRVKERKSEMTRYNGLKIVFTAEEETADQYIEKFSRSHAAAHKTAVVTSDATEQIVTSGHGSKLVSSREFRIRLNDNIRRLNETWHIREEGS